MWAKACRYFGWKTFQGDSRHDLCLVSSPLPPVWPGDSCREWVLCWAPPDEGTLPEELASMRGLVTAVVSTAEGWGPACVCPAGDGRAGSIWPRTFPRGSRPVPPALQAEPVSFLPRRTDRPSRSQICFLRKRGLKAVLRMRTCGTRSWKTSGGGRAATPGAGASPAGSACDGRLTAQLK